MNKKLITLSFALVLTVLPLFAIVNGRSLTNTLKDLQEELRTSFHRRTEAKQRLNEAYEHQHKKMIEVITEADKLSILLYTQEQNMTFNMTYALKKVTNDYKDFNKGRRPYDRIISSLNYEIDRYARLIEALRRLPPVMKEIEVEIVPDSLLYHNDTLEMHISKNDSFLEKEVIRIAVKDSASAPFVLDKAGEAYRDTCIRYASELLRIYANNRTKVIADSTHYQEAHLRMKETYNYARARYQELEKSVFTDGQTPFLEILASPKSYWRRTKKDLRSQYDFEELERHNRQPADSIAADPDVNQKDFALIDNLSSKGLNSILIFTATLQLLALAVIWGLTFLILWLVFRYAKPKHFVDKKQLPLFAVLVGTILYYLVFGLLWKGGEYVQIGVKHVNTFLWLLIAISGSLLLRVKPEQIQSGLRLYAPTFLITLMIIVCRIIFIPDRLLTLLFPPILLLIVLRQLLFCIRESGKATSIDSTLGWVSLAIYVIAFACSFLGFTFAALLILVWWYFQLALLLSIVCVSELLARYKERWVNKRIVSLKARITYVTGEDREPLMFGATWFYDFIKQVFIPVMVVISLPMCVHFSLDIFDFNDLFTKLYHSPFVLLTDKSGYETLCITGESLINLTILFFVLRYLNRAVHAIWQHTRYTAFMRKHNRTSIRTNEINLSLGNSIISVLIWMSYIIVVVVVWKIPVGSLNMVAGGLSAGIGIALKDILNNFIYGIQLMGGRLRVGDWIECDGVRGRVISINYQCVQVETLDGTEMSFLNASLFGKNFNNLTRNNSYEFTKIIVGVAYGTDISKVREVLVEAMQKMRTKDKYGRDIVDPKSGIYVVVDNMSDSSVDIAVKQYVLVAERIGYVDRSKEVIYNALNAAGITIPFPQCDVHLIKDEK